MRCFILVLFFVYLAEVAQCGMFDKLKCYLYECCGQPYLKRDFSKLERTLNQNLFGQPLVVNTLLAALKGHLEIKNPSKALVLSFHGSTGVGKNFVSNLVGDSLYIKGLKSKFVKLFIATRDFSHNEKISEYRDKIKKTVEETVRECPYALFIFDETDKIPIGLMDTIKAYIDFNVDIDGLDFRKSIFIFLSNSAGAQISQLTLEFDKKNKNRNEFELKPFQNAIQDAIYYNKEKDNKGLYHASIIESHLIDFYIPFLPLEKIHIKKCIRTELLKHTFSDQEYYEKHQLEIDIDKIADEINYEPSGYNKFASSGCKRISNLVRNLIAVKRYKIKDEI